jgi:hypothetical protein
LAHRPLGVSVGEGVGAAAVGKAGHGLAALCSFAAGPTVSLAFAPRPAGWRGLENRPQRRARHKGKD